MGEISKFDLFYFLSNLMGFFRSKCSSLWVIDEPLKH